MVCPLKEAFELKVLTPATVCAVVRSTKFEEEANAFTKAVVAI
jgi:hypothetical protein